MVVTKKILVAVYGSLRRTLGNHRRFLQDEKFIGQYETEPIYDMLDLGSFPGLIKNGITSVVMEVFEIDATKLQNIDALEGYSGVGRNNFYNRIQIETPFGKAYTYILNRKQPDPDFPRVESGDWTDYVRTKIVKTYY